MAKTTTFTRYETQLNEPPPHYYKNRNRKMHHRYANHAAAIRDDLSNSLLFRNLDDEIKRITVENYINRLSFLFTQSEVSDALNFYRTCCDKIRLIAKNNKEHIFCSPERMLKRIICSVKKYGNNGGGIITHARKTEKPYN